MLGGALTAIALARRSLPKQVRVPGLLNPYQITT